jgi:hypothetical protein
VGLKIIDKLFTKKNSEGISYQNKFNEDYSREDAINKLESWLKEFSLSEKEIKKIESYVNGEEISEGKSIENMISKNREIVENELKIKGIPTIILDGKKHTGLWKAAE